MAATFLTVMLGWAFFRADTISQAWQWLAKLLFGFDFRIAPLLRKGAPHALLWILVMLVCEWFNREKPYGFARFPENAILRYIIYFAILSITVLNISPRQSFIYFQF